MKTCIKCNRELALEMFNKHKAGKDGYICKCKDCMNEQRRAINKAKKDGTFVSKIRLPRLSEEDKIARDEELKLYHIAYRQNNKFKIAISKKQYVDSLKTEGIRAYGGKCSCCGETIEEFLTIEHLNGRDKNEMRLTGKKMWAKAKSEGFPDTYTVLCFNCNCAKGAFGVCPHQKNLK